MRSRMVYLRNVTSLHLISDQCVGCGMCLIVCPHGVFQRSDDRAVIADGDACMECGACAQNCPAGALSVRAGVGCAAAIINGLLGRDSSSCCCVVESKPQPSHGLPPSHGSGPTGCC
jgi:NAD-dependent dihydropyrimidine dehydrogenase PreA subunit